MLQTSISLALKIDMDKCKYMNVEFNGRMKYGGMKYCFFAPLECSEAKMSLGRVQQ